MSHSQQTHQKYTSKIGSWFTFLFCSQKIPVNHEYQHEQMKFSLASSRCRTDPPPFTMIASFLCKTCSYTKVIFFMLVRCVFIFSFLVSLDHSSLKGFNLPLRSPFELLFMCWSLCHFGAGTPTHVCTLGLDIRSWETGKKTVEIWLLTGMCYGISIAVVGTVAHFSFSTRSLWSIWNLTAN